MIMENPKIHLNSKEGIQIEWEGVLLTIGKNAHHGISGSIAILKGSEIHSVTFHGLRDGIFPMVIHDPEEEPRDTEPEIKPRGLPSKEKEDAN